MEVILTSKIDIHRFLKALHKLIRHYNWCINLQRPEGLCTKDFVNKPVFIWEVFPRKSNVSRIVSARRAVKWRIRKQPDWVNSVFVTLVEPAVTGCITLRVVGTRIISDVGLRVPCKPCLGFTVPVNSSLLRTTHGDLTPPGDCQLFSPTRAPR